MIRVDCVNARCPEGSFLWNELSEIGSPHDLAEPYEVGAIRVVATCVFCGSDNAIWVREANVRRTDLTREENPDLD
jgi:hypothetical protein